MVRSCQVGGCCILVGVERGEGGGGEDHTERENYYLFRVFGFHWEFKTPCNLLVRQKPSVAQTIALKRILLRVIFGLRSRDIQIWLHAHLIYI